MGGPHSARLPELRHRDGLIGVGQHVLDLVAWRGGGAWRTGGASPIAKASASLPPPSARDSPLCDGAARCSMLRSRRSPLAITVQNGHLRCEPLWPRTSQCAWWCTEGRGQKTFVQREFACAKSHSRCDVT